MGDFVTAHPFRSPHVTRGFAVRLARGLVTHWQNLPLATWDQAEECRAAILAYTGERGEIEEVFGWSE